MTAMPIEITGKYLTPEEAAVRLGLTVASVRKYCNSDNPKIIGEKLGRDWRIPEAEIKRYLRERRPVGRPLERDFE